MYILKVSTLFALALAAGLPGLAAGVPAAGDPATGSPAQAPVAAIDAPLQLPLLVWEDGIGVASAPWRASEEDWHHVAMGAAAVLGTALLLDRPIQKALQRHDSPSLPEPISPLAACNRFSGQSLEIPWLKSSYLNGSPGKPPSAAI